MAVFPFANQPELIPVDIMRLAASLGVAIKVNVDQEAEPVQPFHTGERLTILLVNCQASEWQASVLELLFIESLGKRRLLPRDYITRRPGGKVAEIEYLGTWLLALTYSRN